MLTDRLNIEVYTGFDSVVINMTQCSI